LLQEAKDSHLNLRSSHARVTRLWQLQAPKSSTISKTLFVHHPSTDFFLVLFPMTQVYGTGFPRFPCLPGLATPLSSSDLPASKKGARSFSYFHYSSVVNFFI
jgi:hypothetical protein